MKNQEEIISVKHELALPFLLCRKRLFNYHLVTGELVFIRKTIACLYQTGHRTPVSPVTVSTHTPTRPGPTATAQKCVLIAVQHNMKGIYH